VIKYHFKFFALALGTLNMSSSTSRFAPSSSSGGVGGLVNANHTVVRRSSKPAPVVDLGALQNASRVLQDQFAKDAQIIPELGDMLTTRMSYLDSLYARTHVHECLQLVDSLQRRTVYFPTTTVFLSKRSK
jgi:hypothetical protein